MRKGNRVTILGLNYAPEPTGNAPYTTALATYLAGSNHVVTVLSAQPHYPQWKRYPGYTGWRSVARVDGVTLIRLRHWIPRPPRGARRLASELTFGARTAASSWGRPDTVLLVSPALFASWIAMIRLGIQRHPRRVVWVQDLYGAGIEETGSGGRLAVGIARAVERWTLGRAHAVVAIDRVMADHMTDSLGIDPTRVVIVPNWTHVTASDLSREAARARLGWDQNCYIALHAGNMGAKQGLGNIVDAARMADATTAVDRPVRFVLLGDGAERSALEQRGTGVRSLEFREPLSDDLFPVALAAADVLLVNELPGLREMAVPSKLTSYLAAGRPVIAAVGPSGVVARVLAEAQAGSVVSNASPEALFNEVQRFASGSVDTVAMGRAALEYQTARLGADAALGAWESVLRPQP